MESDWSVAAGADDPVIETHWSDAASGLAWIDLRVDANCSGAGSQHCRRLVASPAMARALALLNAPHGMLMTSKCDRWRLSDAELVELAEALDVSLAAYGFGSYIDLLMVHAIPMADFLLHEEWARTAARRCAALNVPMAASRWWSGRRRRMGSGALECRSTAMHAAATKLLRERRGRKLSNRRSLS